MKQRIYCVPCGAHAFDYDGDVHDGGLQSEKATFPDGSHPVPSSEMKMPCGHVVYQPSRDLRVEVLVEPARFCPDCGVEDPLHAVTCLGRAANSWQ